MNRDHISLVLLKLKLIVPLLDDYVVERNDRNKHGGGVPMYIHKSVNYRPREDLSNSDIESISIQVKVCNYKPFIL